MRMVPRKNFVTGLQVIRQYDADGTCAKCGNHVATAACKCFTETIGSSTAESPALNRGDEGANPSQSTICPECLGGKLVWRKNSDGDDIIFTCHNCK